MNEIPRTVKLGCRNLLSQNVVEMDLLYIYYYAFPWSKIVLFETTGYLDVLIACSILKLHGTTLINGNEQKASGQDFIKNT